MTSIEITVVDSQTGKKCGTEAVNIDHINNYREWKMGEKVDSDGFTAVWLSNNKRIITPISKSEFEELIKKAKGNG